MYGLLPASGGGIGFTGDINAGSVSIICYNMHLNDGTGAAITVEWNNSVDIAESGARFKDLYLGGNIYIDGKVDDTDISVHVGDASAHHSSISNGLNITPASIVTSGVIRPSSSEGTDLGTITSSMWFGTLYTKQVDFRAASGNPVIRRAGDLIFEFEAANILCSRHFLPSTTLTLGNSTHKWDYIYRTNESACDLPTSNSAIGTFKKIKKPKIQNGDYGKRHYFTDIDFPDEIKCTHEGKTEIEFTRLIGVSAQAIREIIEKLDTVEKRIIVLENK